MCEFSQHCTCICIPPPFFNLNIYCAYLSRLGNNQVNWVFPNFAEALTCPSPGLTPSFLPRRFHRGLQRGMRAPHATTSAPSLPKQRQCPGKDRKLDRKPHSAVQGLQSLQAPPLALLPDLNPVWGLHSFIRLTVYAHQFGARFLASC